MVVPPFLKTGLRAARACALTPGRMPSSSLITTSFSLPCVRADVLSVQLRRESIEKIWSAHGVCM